MIVHYTYLLPLWVAMSRGVQPTRQNRPDPIQPVGLGQFLGLGGLGQFLGLGRLGWVTKKNFIAGRVGFGS